MTDSRLRLLPTPKNFQDLTDKREVLRLTEQLKTLVAAINRDRTVPEMPIPGNFGVGFGIAGMAVLLWDDLANDLRPYIDGVRIWRAEAASDSRLGFDDNFAKSILVSCIRTTRYVDLEVEAGDYVYWVQWINVDGVAGKVAGGISGTVT